jgi:hypothetical protein
MMAAIGVMVPALVSAQTTAPNVTFETRALSVEFN